MIFRSPWPDIEVPRGSVCDVVFAKAQQLGDKPAVIDGETGRAVTYRELVQQTERVAAGLARAGLRPGQPVAVVLPNSIEFALAWFGTLMAGGWVFPISPLYTAAELRHQIHDSGARFLITTPERGAELQGEVERVFATGGNWNELLECDGPRPDVHPKPDDLAVLPYSSGTTGKPKGVMLTHSNIVANMAQVVPYGWPRPDDVIVNMMPLYHAAGLNAMLTTFLHVGATIVQMPRFDLVSYLELNQRYGATCLGAPPPVIVALTKSPLWGRFQCDTLGYGICGAAPLGAEMHEAFEQKTGIFLGQVWGMTEATAVVTLTPNDPARRKFGSCGYLLPSSEAMVVDVISQQPLGAGETGELWIRGPNIMKGYWNQPQATAETLVGDGWMRTGDLGYFDADGCIYLVDRLKELIKYNALQVAPAELEDLIQSHPAVRDAAVIGAPDPVAGEIPMAFVVRKEGAHLEADELMQYVAARVAPHKKVRAVAFLEAIPKSPSGKILRRVLKESVQSRAAG